MAERLGQVHAALERFWAAADQALPHPPDTAWRARFATAVAEIAANIVEHAYPPGMPAGRLRLRLRAYPTYVEAQFCDAGIPFQPWASAAPAPALAAPVPPVGVAPAGSRGAPPATSTTRAGAGSAAGVPAADDVAGALAVDIGSLPEGGFGLALARAAVDACDYSRTPDGRNRWRLVKRLEAPA